jgi:hypothetical protein
MSLYPVKVRQIIEELTQSSALSRLVQDSSTVPVKHPDDAKQRIVLCSAELRAALREQLLEAPDLSNSRIRLAIPTDVTKLYVAENTCLEVYDVDGNLLFKPWAVTNLVGHVSSALQAELFHAILRAQGSKIPMHA